jgi:hypothetical protein
MSAAGRMVSGLGRGFSKASPTSGDPANKTAQSNAESIEEGASLTPTVTRRG